MKKEVNQMKFTNQGEKNYSYTRNEVLNKINEIKLKAEINHDDDDNESKRIM